jgi:hypothetical protein
MPLPAVDQAKMIVDQLGRAIVRWGPRSIAAIGCAGGHGRERIAAGARSGYNASNSFAPMYDQSP